ncbi:alpha/beta fold hydrolase [Methylobacterium haplocladii]|uniref:Esterase n=1 Tax=Methylobacterium haplocladii TaxID=1176176 RepID=A0A512IQR8_9HYPH|nr:alpha/beta hydrolase [Methylobacterium haplocladii]GEP00057.1 esterase [Methylobacterium haplocladii]GLS59328.1 esterase [Methylobacterium haplocladii]
MRILKGVAAFSAGAAVLLGGLVVAALAAGAGATVLIAFHVESLYPPNGRFVPVRGGRLAVLEAGPTESPRGTVVLLHGASASAADPMEGIGRTLAKRGYRVIAFDRPGFGWSDRLAGPEAASPGFQADAIGRALDAMEAGPAIVLGHSWSGALALRLALDRPDHVAGLVLAAPVALPFPDKQLPWWGRLALQPAVTGLLVRTVVVPIAWWYLPKAAKGAFTPQAMSEGYVERSRAPLILRPGAALANLEDLAGLPAALREQAPRYGEIRVPTVVAAGESDPVVRIQTQAVPLAEQIPGARLVRLRGIGHMLHYVATDALADAVDGVRAEVEPPPAR